MLIFDSFPSVEQAEAFRVAVRDTWPELQSWLYDSNAAAQERELFPGELEPPIVHVERPWSGDDDAIEYARSQGFANDAQTAAEIESEIEELVDDFGGEFAGT